MKNEADCKWHTLQLLRSTMVEENRKNRFCTMSNHVAQLK